MAIYRFRIDERSEEVLRLGNQELLDQMRQIPGLVAHYSVHVSDDESLQISVYEEEAQLNQFEKVVADWLQQSLAPKMGHPYHIAPLEVIHGHVKARTTPTHQHLDLKP